MQTAVVPVKSGWASKVNWIAFAPFAASMLAAFGFNLSSDDLVKVFGALQAIQTVGTIVVRTFFTKSVTKASVGG